MLELTRGYAAAVLDEAQVSGNLDRVVTGLEGLSSTLVASEALRNVLTDGSVPSEQRSALLNDLLTSRVDSAVCSLATFAVHYERATELPKTYEQLLEIATERAQSAPPVGSSPLEAESPIGRTGGLERMRGYAERVFERIDSQDGVDEVEDELFRLARIAEQQRDLRAALSGAGVALEARLGVLNELLSSKVRRETLSLIAYVLRTGRARDLVGALDYLVELAATERGRRVAEVRAAVELSDSERERLVAALSERTRRSVELRVVIDPSVIGGLGVSVGDTVIDGTVRYRLERLREALLSPS
jgi:F-type H+-transporting ATPase subunit delta